MNCCTTSDQVPPISKANRFTKLQYLAALLCGQTEILAQINAAGSGQVLAPDGTALTVKRTFANVAASSTDANLVTAVTGKKIRVLGYAIHGGDTAGSDVTFNRKPVGAGLQSRLSRTFRPISKWSPHKATTVGLRQTPDKA